MARQNGNDEVRYAAAYAEANWSASPRLGALSLSDQIASEIGSRIITGGYAPGERLLEQQISAEFHVSRNPVREALRILERDGFVDILPRRGAQVVDPDEDEIAEIFEVVAKMFELTGNRLASTRSTAGQRTLSDAITKLTELLESGASAERHLLIVNALSVRLADLTGNQTLKQIVSRLMIRGIAYIRSSLLSDERRRQSIENWRSLLHAVEKGDVVAAEAAGRSMVAATFSAAVKAHKRSVS